MPRTLTPDDERRAAEIVAGLRSLAGQVEAHRASMSEVGARRSALARELASLLGPGEAARRLGVRPTSLARLRGGLHGSSDRIKRHRA